MTNLRKIAEHQKNHRATKIENRILKQTHDKKLDEYLSPITRKLDIFNDSTRKVGEIYKKSDVEDENAQTPALEIITGTQSLRDILTLMKSSKNFFKLEEKSNGDVFWNGAFTQPLRVKKN